jgi:hypothetical protein
MYIYTISFFTKLGILSVPHRASKNPGTPLAMAVPGEVGRSEQASRRMRRSKRKAARRWEGVAIGENRRRGRDVELWKSDTANGSNNELVGFTQQVVWYNSWL